MPHSQYINRRKAIGPVIVIVNMDDPKKEIDE